MLPNFLMMLPIFPTLSLSSKDATALGPLVPLSLSLLSLSLVVPGADPGGGLGGLQPPVLSPAPGKWHGKRAQSRAELPTIL